MSAWNDAALAAAFGQRLRRHEPLSRHSTFHVGGPADLFLTTHSAEELETAVRLAGAAGIPIRVLGSGANVLPSDAGVRGLVLRNVSRRFLLEVDDNRVTVESGMVLPVLARRTARAGLDGLTWGCGVPGTVGGAVANNAGCYGASVSDRLVSVRTVDAAGEVREWPAAALTFSYRSSPFKAGAGQEPAIKAAILGATFALQPGEAPALLAQVARWLEQRAATQPLDHPSAGSFFKNPPGDFAGRLIEAAGLKGQARGQAQVSTKHANFFINQGHATATDLYLLALDVRQQVEQRTGVRLEREVELIGAWDHAADL
ncbi:MAG TPA: UDP-N-acetylmuramate dehydrogenase [Chloroflexota bacterium]|jgi:UDP-N-acetylmuramate dehydrogenase|nr:UDP-N-acetylmuramate dehydrogenase [Chloroflexota bacterium]